MLLRRGSVIFSLNVLILFLLSLVHFSTQNGIYGSYLNAAAAAVFNGIGYKMCIKKCAVFSPLHCKSFSFNMYDYSCNIYDKDTTTSSLVEAASTWYWDREHIPVNLGGPCKAVSCSKTEKCVVLHGGRTKCLVNECNEPPAVANAIANPGKNTVKAVRTYTCSQGYSLTGTNSVTCKANGFWTSPSFSCIVDCGTPPTLANGSPSYSSTTYQSVVTYTCATNYALSPGGSTGQISCPSSGTWPSLGFTCESASSCSGTTYNGKCYYLGSSAKTWSAASTDCQAQGGNLVDITSLEENNIMKQVAGTAASNLVWIGGTDEGSEGSFKWSSNNQAFTYTDWYGNDPDGGTSQNCVCTYSTTLQWIDNSCTSSLYYICEK